MIYSVYAWNCNKKWQDHGITLLEDPVKEGFMKDDKSSKISNDTYLRYMSFNKINIISI